MAGIDVVARRGAAAFLFIVFAILIVAAVAIALNMGGTPPTGEEDSSVGGLVGGVLAALGARQSALPYILGIAAMAGAMFVLIAARSASAMLSVAVVLAFALVGSAQLWGLGDLRRLGAPDARAEEDDKVAAVNSDQLVSACGASPADYKKLPELPLSNSVQTSSLPFPEQCRERWFKMDLDHSSLLQIDVFSDAGAEGQGLDMIVEVFAYRNGTYDPVRAQDRDNGLTAGGEQIDVLFSKGTWAVKISGRGQGLSAILRTLDKTPPMGVAKPLPLDTEVIGQLAESAPLQFYLLDLGSEEFRPAKAQAGEGKCLSITGGIKGEKHTEKFDPAFILSIADKNGQPLIKVWDSETRSADEPFSTEPLEFGPSFVFPEETSPSDRFMLMTVEQRAFYPETAYTGQFFINARTIPMDRYGACADTGKVASQSAKSRADRPDAVYVGLAGTGDDLTGGADNIEFSARQ